MKLCQVFAPHQHEVQRNGSGKFGASSYFASIDLGAVARSALGGKASFVMRPFIVEVTDIDGDLHAAAGATVAIITEGSGYLRTESAKLPFRVGSILVIPPRVLHLSVAAPETRVVEYGVYVGDEHDLQRAIGL